MTGGDSPEPRAPRRQLSLWDTTSIIVGIVVGSGIYMTTPSVARAVGSPGELLLLWLAGGSLALCGAMTYAELATTYPSEGGEYVYLTRAWGGPLGFLFSWTQLWIIRPGSVGAMAFVLARYADRLHPLGPPDVSQLIYALGCVCGLSLVNLFGAREGKWTQNGLTIAKILGLLLLVLVGWFATPDARPPLSGPMPATSLPLAAILIMFTYGGWNDMPMVAAEVRDPERNLSRALVLGTTAVTAIYLLVNLAFVRLLGLEGLARSQAVGADALRVALGERGETAISLLIVVSCLGAIQGTLFTGARVYFAAGGDHPFFAWTGKWNERLRSPLRGFVLQTAVTLGLIGFIGRRGGQAGFERTFVFTAPAFWFFIVLAVLSLFVLRRREPDRPRPYRVPGYPVIPAIFGASALFMLYSSLNYAWNSRGTEAQMPIAILAVGLAIALAWRRR